MARIRGNVPHAAAGGGSSATGTHELRDFRYQTMRISLLTNVFFGTALGIIAFHIFSLSNDWVAILNRILFLVPVIPAGIVLAETVVLRSRDSHTWLGLSLTVPQYTSFAIMWKLYGGELRWWPDLGQLLLLAASGAIMPWCAILLKRSFETVESDNSTPQCANCGYSLRGLQRRGKCPECGEDY